MFFIEKKCWMCILKKCLPHAKKSSMCIWKSSPYAKKVQCPLEKSAPYIAEYKKEKVQN